MFRYQAGLYILIIPPSFSRLFSSLISICLFQYPFIFLKNFNCSSISFIFWFCLLRVSETSQSLYSNRCCLFQDSLYCINLTRMESLLLSFSVSVFTSLFYYYITPVTFLERSIEIKLLCHYVLGNKCLYNIQYTFFSLFCTQELNIEF